MGTPNNPAFATKFHLRLAMDAADPPKLYGDESDKVAMFFVDRMTRNI